MMNVNCFNEITVKMIIVVWYEVYNGEGQLPKPPSSCISKAGQDSGLLETVGISCSTNCDISELFHQWVCEHSLESQ